jgi:predicted  nucleic acid-binding Zn-ribbon protein
MSQSGPFYLRWRPAGSSATELERFDDLDAALDAAEARWETLRDQAPQVLDARKVLLLSTDELRGEFDAQRE